MEQVELEVLALIQDQVELVVEELHLQLTQPQQQELVVGVVEKEKMERVIQVDPRVLVVEWEIMERVQDVQVLLILAEAVELQVTAVVQLVQVEQVDQV